MKYLVTLRFRFPAWDEKNGIPYEVEASSKSDAIKSVRRQAYNDGHTVGQKATDITFTATEIES
jgi:hypothetical protein